MYSENVNHVVHIQPEELIQRLESGMDIQIIDVREPFEVLFGTLPGAKNIRLAELPHRLDDIDREREAVIVCQSGGRSTVACEFLLSQGFRRVKNLDGGMVAWRKCRNTL